MVCPTDLVKQGRITRHPLTWWFKRYLRGRKPSLILAFGYLMDDVGMLFALQHDLAQAEPLRRVDVARRMPKPETVVEFDPNDLLWETSDAA